MDRSKLTSDPEYVHGQIESLRALVLALAQSIPKEEFRENALQRLDHLKTAGLASPVEDSFLQAVDDCEAWVKNVT